MLEAFLIALREGAEIALVVGICLVYLRRTGRQALEPVVWTGVGAALAASAAGALLLARFGWSQEGVEGVLLLVAAVLLVTMILWMRRVARRLRGEIEGEVERLARRSRFAALGLFLFVFSMVLREGIETVIFLQAVAMNVAGALFFAGTLLGLGLAVALSIFFFRGTLRIRLDRFFEATSLMLIVLAAQLVLNGVHELSEAQWIPTGPRLMAVLGPIVRHDVIFLNLLLGVATWLAAQEFLRRRQGGVPAGMDPAAERRLRGEQARERRWLAATALTAFAVLMTLTLEHVYANTAAALTPPAPVFAAEGLVRMPAARFSDGELHRFTFSENGTTILFLVIRQPDGHLATALEACTICGAHGYYQDGENVVCRNCAAEIPITHLGTPGGCNPVLIRSWTEGDELVIPASALLGGARFFQRP